MRRRPWWDKPLKRLIPVRKSNGGSALEKYLRYYESLPYPGFAVFVTGKWGAGKTYQVKNALGKWGKKQEFYYVSLFGLVSPDDIVSAVYYEMYPSRGMLRRLWMALTGSQVLGVSLGGLHSLARITMRDRVRTDRTIIFDDLERTALEHNVILGVINHYVENHGCHVVVICNDGKLANSYRSWKEKVFGQNVRVTAKPHETFDEFAKSLDDEDSLADYRKDILDVFDASRVGSLRILKQTMADIIRMLKIVDPHQSANDLSMRELVSLFAAISFEARSERLTSKDVRNRSGRSLTFRMNVSSAQRNGKERPSKPPIVRASERYEGVSLESDVISDELLTEMIFDGRFDRTRFNEHLAQTAQFATPEKLAPWRKVAGFQKLDDSIVAEGIAELEEQFGKRLIVEQGEMLHLFALRFMLSSKGVIRRDFDEVEKDCRLYVSDLLDRDEMPVAPDNKIEELRTFSGALGFTFWVEPEYEENFDRVVQMVRESTAEAQSREHKAAVPTILDLVRSDGRRFFDEFVHTANGNPTYASSAVLQHINPAEFVKAWASSPPDNWYWIKGAIDHRHEHPRRELAEEREWVNSVRELMQDNPFRREGTDGVAALRASQFDRSIPKVPAGSSA